MPTSFGLCDVPKTVLGMRDLCLLEINKDCVLCKKRLQRDSLSNNNSNLAINALAGKFLKEQRNTDDLLDAITIENFQSLAIARSNKCNLSFFEDEELPSVLTHQSNAT